MFGFSFSELVVVIVVALVVIGPKDLPKMLRKLGQYAGKLRRMAADLRAQSGIDDALRSEGLADDINEIRKLARGELDTIQRSVTADPGPKAGVVDAAKSYGYNDDFYVVRDREFPRDGADSYGALPDNAIVYADGMPKTALARDPLYVLGDANGVVPEEPKPEESEEEAAAGEPAAAAGETLESSPAHDADAAAAAHEAPGEKPAEQPTSEAH
ncbi:MAG: twin-arginine translocase subunit TatB [Deltaproteobacteria bacterium]|nr:twin-arginine translocase subunit TatB [Deltaproteobacteria bacterium]